MLRNERRLSIKYKTAIFIILRYLQKWLRTNENFTNNVHLILEQFAACNLLLFFLCKHGEMGKESKPVDTQI